MTKKVLHILKEESGTRYLLRCCLPCANTNAPQLATLREKLCAIAGGFTEYYMTGTWQNPDTNEILNETGLVFEVSVRYPHQVKYTRAEFITAGFLLGEDWLHIELHEYEALHTRVN